MVLEEFDDPPLLFKRREGHWDLAYHFESESRPPHAVTMTVRPATNFRTLHRVHHPAAINVGVKTDPDAVRLNDRRAERWRCEASTWEHFAQRRDEQVAGKNLMSTKRLEVLL